MTIGKYIAAGGILGGIIAIGLGTWRLLAGPDRVIKDIEPDFVPTPLGKTKWKGVNAILGKLQAAAQSTGIPLGLMVGWVGMESGGRLATKPQPGPGDTSMDERGYFQLTPEESDKLRLDHQRLSTDSDYSIDAGIKLIRKYQSTVNDLGFPAGTAFYWRLVKLVHSMGVGQVPKIVKAAKAAGAASSWDQLEQFALGMSINGPQPKKWFPFVDSVYAVGHPFGFGSETALVAGLVFDGEIVGDSGLDLLGAESA